MLRRNKKEIWGCLIVCVQQVINMFSGLGKESGGCWREGVIQVWIKKLIYNPTNFSLPILQAPQTYTF
jgi:hypothetical protein